MKFSELENTKRQELLLLNEVLALVRPLDGKRYKQVSHDFAALNEAVKRVEKYAGLLPQDIQKYGEDDHGGIPRLSLTKIQARCTFVSQEIDGVPGINWGENVTVNVTINPTGVPPLAPKPKGTIILIPQGGNAPVIPPKQ